MLGLLELCGVSCSLVLGLGRVYLSLVYGAVVPLDLGECMSVVSGVFVSATAEFSQFCDVIWGVHFAVKTGSQVVVPYRGSEDECKHLKLTGGSQVPQSSLLRAGF